MPRWVYLLMRLATITPFLAGGTARAADEGEASDVQKYPAYFAEWTCEQASPMCKKPWGMTGQGGLDEALRRALGGDADTYFVQYSRPNDDTPAGMNPDQILNAEVGASQASELLRRRNLERYERRAELVKICEKFIQDNPAFYEVVAVTFAVGARADAETGRGRHLYHVAFSNLLESTSGRYERAAETQGFKFTAELDGKKLERGYATKYQPGIGPRSEARDKIGTIAEASHVFANLRAGQTYHAKLSIDSPGGVRFKNCTVEFRLPLTEPAKIQCERFKFPPLLVIRTNTEATIDSVRYRKPPASGDCFASETVADGGLSDNALFGAILRENAICTGCHVRYEGSEPFGGDLLCPPAQDEQAVYSPEGNAKNPNLVAGVIRRFFEKPELASVPKHNGAMKDDLDFLKLLYCERTEFDVTENGKKVKKRVDQVLDAWVKNYDNPHQLSYDAICGD